MNCPHCKSDQCQTLPMIWQSGISSGTSTGVAYTFGVGATIAQGYSNSSTALARQAAPPNHPPSRVGAAVLLCVPTLLGAVVATACLISGSPAGAVLAFLCFLFSVVMLLPAIGFIVWAVKQHEKEKAGFLYWWDIWNKTWMCIRCGTRFNPYQPSLQPQSVDTQSPLSKTPRYP